MVMSEQTLGGGQQPDQPLEAQGNLFDYIDCQSGEFHLGLFNQGLSAYQLVSAYQDSCHKQTPEWQEDVHQRLRQQAALLNKAIRTAVFDLDLYDAQTGGLVVNPQEKGQLLARLYASGDRALFGQTTQQLICQRAHQPTEADETCSGQPSALDDLLANSELILRNLARQSFREYLGAQLRAAEAVETNQLVGFYVHNNAGIRAELERAEPSQAVIEELPAPAFQLPATNRKFSLKAWHDYYQSLLAQATGSEVEAARRQQLKGQLLARLNQLRDQTELKINQLACPSWRHQAIINLIESNRLNYVRQSGDIALLGRHLASNKQQGLERLNRSQQAQEVRLEAHFEPAVLLAMIKVYQRFNHPSRKLDNLMRAQDTYRQLSREVVAELRRELPNQYQQLAYLESLVAEAAS